MSLPQEPWTSFAPIQLLIASNASAAVQAGFDLGNGVVLGQRDQKLLDAGTKDLGCTAAQTQRLRRANVLLRVDYQANALGDLSPGSPISKQDVAETKLRDSTVALWLARPAELGFESTFHVCEGPGSQLSRCNTNRYLPFQSLTMDYDAAEHGLPDLLLARQLLDSYASLSEDSAIARAWHLLFGALGDLRWDTRCLTLWTAVEAVLGADSEITYRLSLRAALLLGNDREHAKQIFDCVKGLYRWRSVTVHGRSSKKVDIRSSLLATQALLRTVLVAILSDPRSCAAFISEDARTGFLDGLAFTRLPQP